MAPCLAVPRKLRKGSRHFQGVRLFRVGSRRSSSDRLHELEPRPAAWFSGIYAKEVVENVLAWPEWLAGLRRALVPSGRLWLSTPNYGEPWLPALESTVLELVARRSGFTRRHLHPTRFSRGSLVRGLRAAGFESVETRITPTRLVSGAMNATVRNRWRRDA
jgi:Methyltransferase domain